MLVIGTAVRSGTLVLPHGDWAAWAEAVLHTVDAALQHTAPTWLGHCKLLIETAETVVYASLVEANGTISWSGSASELDTEAAITLYCAVYGVDDDQANNAVEHTLRQFPAVLVD